MKFNLLSRMSWVLIITMVLGTILMAGAVVVLFVEQEIKTVFDYSILVVSFSSCIMGLIIIFIVLRRDFISTMTIASDGISVRCYGKPWFAAYWEELYMGEYIRPYRFGGETLMYFSKKPVEYRDLQDYAYRLGNNHKSKGDIVFLLLSPKSKQEILKYVDSKDIIQHGLVDAVKAPKQNRNNQD